MRKTWWATLALVLMAVSAWAGQGVWEHVDAVPQAASSGYLSVSAVDENTLFSVGINQFSAYGAQWAWRSTDAGETMVPIFLFEGSGDDCEMMKFFTFMIDGDWYDIDHGVVVGMSVPDECMEQYEFPACMFICMFQMKPFIWTVADGGDTFVQHDAGGNITKTFTDLKIVGETIFACGSNGLLRRSDDFGESWSDLPPPETGTSSIMNDMWWLDTDVGFIGTSAPSPESSKSLPTSYEEFLAAYEAQRTYNDFMKNGVARLELLAQGYNPTRDAKGQFGNLYKTIDGGHTWEMIYEGGIYSIYKVQFLDEMNGFIVTDEVVNDEGGLNTILYTHDGGATWDKAVIPEDGPGAGTRYIITDIRMLTPSLGYAVGAVATGFFYNSVILVTTDGGANWVFDTIGVGPNYTGNTSGYGFNGVDFADNTRGFTVGMYLSVGRYTGTNAAPTADAGDDISGQTGDVLQLDGSGSSDPDGDALLYFWSVIDGPADLAFDNAFIVNPTFTPTVAGTYTVELQVSDVEYQATDTVTVTVEQGPPPDDDDDTTDDDTTDDDDDDVQADDDDDDSGCGC